MRLATALLASLVTLAAGCYRLTPSAGGGQVKPVAAREIEPADVGLPEGYSIERVADGLTFPTGVALDDEGRPFVVEAGYSYGEAFAVPRLLRIDDGGRAVVVATGDDAPWNGVAFAKGDFFVAAGGETKGGRILRISPSGEVRALVEGLPSLGDHHTDGPAIGGDGFIYFGQGTATNSGVVGADDFRFGWLSRHPEFHDTPCQDLVLRGENYESEDPLHPGGKATTGGYSAFGTPTRAGQTISGAVPCNGAVMRVPLEGGMPELVAWGFRNPYGLAFAPDGTLYVTDNGFDERGSRPIFGAGDPLWRVGKGGWYGWPDYAQGEPVDSDRFQPPGKPKPRRLLAQDPGRPPSPVAILGVHSSANGFDFSRSVDFGHAGEAFVALFGDMAPETGKVEGPVGFKVARVNVSSGVVEDFAVNKKGNGPASKVGGGGLERPIAARFDPSGRALYVVDFGVLTADSKGVHPQKETGVLWRITRKGHGR